VLTSGLTLPAPTTPVENEPVAMGTRSPIRSVAFSSFKARISGFWRIFESEALASMVNDPPGMLIAKFPIPTVYPPPPLELRC